MILRRIKSHDLHTIFDARNDERVMKWCRQYAPLHYDDHLKWFDWQRTNPKIEMFAIENHGIIQGICGLTDVDLINKHAEFSLYILPHQQRQGHGYNALKLLFNFGFDSLNLNRIWGETFDGNPALRLFETLGMEITGVRPEHYFKNGKYLDAFLLSLSREKWYSIRS